ncbi:MAG: hypothetical protein P1V51_12245 [Deltaproteobacteria bacterium]|nr:hypothetical protein [Deltaproteobacteria bacterium]
MAGCSLHTTPPGVPEPTLQREAEELDLLIVSGGEGEAATLLVGSGGEVAAIDGGPLGGPLAVLLDLCQRWGACEPDHVIATPAPPRGSPGLLFLLAGEDRQPGTDDDRVPAGARLEIDSERPCPALACHALRDLLGPERAARDGDTLLLGEGHRLRLTLEGPSPRLSIWRGGEASRVEAGALLWGPAPCRLPAGSEGWAFADLTRCPGGTLELEAPDRAPPLVVLSRGAGDCEALERDHDLLQAAGSRVLVVGEPAEGARCRLPGPRVGRHLILRVGGGEARPLRLEPDGALRPLPTPPSP